MGGRVEIERTKGSVLYILLESSDQSGIEPLAEEITHIAGANGGHVLRSEGPGLTIVFAIPFARFPARDAQQAAENVRALLERTADSDWKMGIATGEGIMEGEKFLSPCTAQARDLAAAAPSQTIELDDETRRVVEESSAESPQVVFGREKERFQIESVFEACRELGRCHQLLLVAEPGIGKSHLAYEVVERLQGRARVATTRCLPWGFESLEPLEGLLEQLVPGLEDDPVAAIARVLASEDDAEVVQRQVCGLFGWSESSYAEDVSVWSIRRLLEVLAKDQPLVLLIDSLQWAAEPMINAIEDFITRLEGPVMLLTGTRPELLHRRPGLAYESEQSKVARLAPFDDEKSLELIEVLLEGPVERADWVEELVKVAQGSPLFIAETVSHLRETGQLIRGLTGWRVADDQMALSPTIEAVIASRIKALPDDEREVIDAASVWLGDFEVEHIVALVPGFESADILSRLSRLQTKNFIEGMGPTTFSIRHRLIEKFTYQLIAKEKRVELHRHAAYYAGQKEMSGALIGYHLEQAARLTAEISPEDPLVEQLSIEASEHLAYAGRVERIRGANRSALDLLTRATTLRPDKDAEWVAIAIEAAECAKDIGDLKLAREISGSITQVAADLGDPQLTARAKLLDIWLRIDSPDPQLKASLRELLPIFKSVNDDAALVETYRGLGEWYWFNGQCGPAAENYELAMQHSLKTPERRDLGQLLASIAKAALWSPLPLSQGVELCSRLVEIAAGDPFPRAQVGWRWGSMDGLRGDFDSARARMNESKEILAEVGQELALAIGTQESGMMELLAGDMSAAHDEFKHGFEELTRLGDIEYRASNAALLGRVLYDMGRTDEADECVRIAEESIEDDPAVQQDVYPVRAQMAADQGNGEEAQSLLAKARESAYESDVLTAQAHIEIQAVWTYRKLGWAKEEQDALARVKALCDEKEASALLALVDR